jgi:hypothetical protein
MTSPRIEPATFQLVAYCLTQRTGTLLFWCISVCVFRIGGGKIKYSELNAREYFRIYFSHNLYVNVGLLLLLLNILFFFPALGIFLT